MPTNPEHRYAPARVSTQHDRRMQMPCKDITFGTCFWLMYKHEWRLEPRVPMDQTGPPLPRLVPVVVSTGDIDCERSMRGTPGSKRTRKAIARAGRAMQKISEYDEAHTFCCREEACKALKIRNCGPARQCDAPRRKTSSLPKCVSATIRVRVRGQ